MGPDPRAFGSGTTPRFAVLVLAAAATMWNCWQVLAGAVLGTPYRLATERCVGALVSALGVDGQDIDRAAAAAPAEGAAVAATVDACSTRVGATAAAIAVAAVVVLVAGAALAYWLWPSWHIRRRRLIAFPAAAFPVPAAKLAKLAGNTEVRFLLDPADNRVDGRAFGRYGRRYVILTRGLLERWRKNDGDGSVDAVVSHELAHIRNRDIDPAYAAVWTWRLLVLLGGVPFGCWVLVELAMGDRRTALGYGWRIVALLGLTLLIRNGLLRAREYYADLRAGRSCPNQLRRLLRTAPDPTRRARLRARFGLHPSVAERRRMLDEPGELLAPRALSLVTVGLSAMLAYDLVDAVTAVAGLRTPIAPLAGMTLTTLVATAGIAQAALRSALWVRVAGDDHPWRGSAFHIPLVALAHGLALAAGLVLGRLLSLDPVAHGSIRHTWAATREFVSGWAFVLGMSCVAVTACVHVAAHTWLPVVATVTRPRVALATVAIGAAVLMLPWLPSLLWAYFLYARLPWEESGAPSWVTGELMQRQRLPAGLLGGWGLLAAVVALTLLLAAPRLRRAHPPTQSWTGTSEATRLQPPLGIRATVGTAAAASFLTLSIVSEYGFHTATWPGADVTSMALMASSPASRAIVASTAGSKWMLCHQSGTPASGLRSECLRYGPDPRRQECSAHPLSCRPSVHVAPGKGLVTRVAPPEGYRPAIGETVVFDGARAGWVTTDMAYRTALVIAAGGDRVTCAGAGAPILVNGQPPVDGGILFPAGRIGAEAFDQTVPEGGMWVLGTAARPQDGSDRHLGEGGGVVAASSVLLYFAEK
ncbi:M48 family metalloprotease [Nocardia asiatica]|uniref:M48 family metalloprotease n=1 Tax=Nocardia asiatica TaxID=209252 RepID=UPI003EE3AB85